MYGRGDNPEMSAKNTYAIKSINLEINTPITRLIVSFMQFTAVIQVENQSVFHQENVVLLPKSEILIGLG